LRTFACSQTIMYGLLPSARHCLIWQRSFEIEGLCRSIAATFLFSQLIS
jgi:hypothetical protein